MKKKNTHIYLSIYQSREREREREKKNIYITLAKELSATTSIMQSSSKELSTLVADRV